MQEVAILPPAERPHGRHLGLAAASKTIAPRRSGGLLLSIAHGAGDFGYRHQDNTPCRRAHRLQIDMSRSGAGSGPAQGRTPDNVVDDAQDLAAVCRLRALQKPWRADRPAIRRPVDGRHLARRLTAGFCADTRCVGSTVGPVGAEKDRPESFGCALHISLLV